MRIVLLQDEIYLPSFAGGIKANRFLAEELACVGHDCLALTRALTSSPDGPNTLQEFHQELDSRQIDVNETATDVYAYKYCGVDVDAINCTSTDARSEYLVERIRQFDPDWVLVADDKRRFMLPSATVAAPGRVVPLLQTIVQLPFGPLSVNENVSHTELMRQAPGIIVISEFLQRYIREHGQMRSHVLRMPVYGPGPFPNLARSDTGFVTMINPCELKGVSIFLAMAHRFPTIPFAAVPTWGANDSILQQLSEIPNIRVLNATDDIDLILGQTRVLLVPSLWPETFGYVVPEAMLRGIPVLASNLGGLPEAKLGVDYLLPVTPARRDHDRYICPTQVVEPWCEALQELLDNHDTYDACSQRSRDAALDFAANATVTPFEQLLMDLSERQAG